MIYNQYEVVIVNLNPTVGSEIQKTRPCLVISPKEMNYDNVIVAPMTSTNKDYPTRVKLKNDSFVVLDQIRTISTQRIVKKTDIKLSTAQIKEIKNIIKLMLVD
ncbi:MAG: growth inhibitor PemK [Sulfurimonas sp. RIFCSPLOWO2_12_FULL_36_74]|uniref:type II toxin-antitoxin system PemK/MazF family toxin n=1 Tax=unclassified Sulfurimonas TaxID=2623549 RepID=UPI0008AFDD2A|nr:MULTISPECIES: type II toxin-antitoxin system PemK/MazF family toxin [unclassified Sulfurimonas]OHE01190.1 MAG: growth inhibitor PemK [Sulfurimonas sp. RIFCSPLOWO2_12_36_12]OHE03092.1 MAG: growth inhibitor PemK [Sulfurimonas sp. RIFCSPLOWO2_12_FULL_36_74]